MKQPIFKKSILAQATAIACLSMAASMAHATVLPCAGGVASGDVTINAVTVASCHVTGGGLQITADYHAIPAPYTNIGPSQYLVSAAVGDVVRDGVSAGGNPNGLEVRALSLYTGEGVFNARATLGTFANHDSLSRIINGVSVLASGVSNSWLGAHEQGSSTASIGTLSNDGQITAMFGNGISVAAQTVNSTAFIGAINNAAGGIIAGSNAMMGTAAGISVAAQTMDLIGVTQVSAAQASIGVIENSGVIRGGDGILVSAFDGGSHASITTIDNKAGGQIQGSSGMLMPGIGGSGISVGNSPMLMIMSMTSGNAVSEASIHSIVNSGEISGAQQGILVGANGRIDEIVNNIATTPGTNGVISGGVAGIAIAGGLVGSVSNSGVISSAGDGIVVSGGRLQTLDNSGLISGGAGAAINLSGSSEIGVIRNTGTIAGATGIAVTDSTVLLGINNSASGVILAATGKAIDLSAAGSAITINNSGLIQGNVALGNGAQSPLAGPVLNLNGNSPRVVGEVSGGNSATVNLNGAFLTEGKFAVGSFNINENAALTMRHDIGAAAGGLQNKGTLFIPADAAVSITGNYVQGAAGLLETGVTSASTYGRLTVSGDADLSASNRMAVRVTPQDSLVAGAVMPNVIRAQGTLTAGAVSVTDNSALWNFTARRNGDKGLDLVTALAVVPTPEPVPVPVPVAEAPPAVTPAPRVGVTPMIENTRIGMPALGAARVIDQFLVTGNASGDMQTVLNALGALGTQQEVAGAVSQMVPVLTGGMAQTTMGAMHSTNRVVQARMESARGLSSGDELKLSHGWLKPFGSWARQDDRNGVAGFNADTYGLVLGGDSELSGTARAGAAFAYSHTKVDSNTGLQRSKVDTYQAIVYASRSLDAKTDINVQADIGMNRNDADRDLRFAGISRTASASYNSWNTHLGAGIGRILDLGAKTTFTPSVRADYMYIRDRAYTETGADALNLQVRSKSTDELIFALDGKFNHALTESTSLTANLGVGYDALASQSAITTSFVGGGAAFVTNGLEPSRWLARGGLGLSSTYANGLEVSVRYDLETRRSFSNQTASLKFRMPF
jgi:outer membrane autotransporter protein